MAKLVYEVRNKLSNSCKLNSKMVSVCETDSLWGQKNKVSNVFEARSKISTSTAWDNSQIVVYEVKTKASNVCET